MATVEWFAAPWPCGHNDPVYVDHATQECAVCHARRMEPVRAFRIWTLWRDHAEDTGLIVTTATAEDALRAASRMGTFSGLGFDRRYQGAHAQVIA